MATPGLMFVVSRVRDYNEISDRLYNRFYNKEHLGQILAGGQIKLALRYKNVAGTDATIPYIALYPVDDASFIGSPEHLKLIEEAKISTLLAGWDVNKLIDFELRPYEKIQTYEAHGHDNGNKNATDKQRARTLTVSAIEPAEGHDEDLDAWYRKQHLDMLNMVKGFRRCTRYVRKDGACPRYLALAEYDCVPKEWPKEQINRVYATEWSKEILAAAKVHEQDVFRLIQAQGDTHLKL
ncbi:hypothetical protein F5Y10DRAFT_244197 [Nemania abortiva]|nr:hypothetical protein F5Y10DRAFT_244197 [Nemania abortiva]